MAEKPKNLVWVEIPDTIERIDEALKKEETDLHCGECGSMKAVSYEVILRDSTKIDTMTGMAVKIKKKGYLCHKCLKALRTELEEMEKEEQQ